MHWGKFVSVSPSYTIQVEALENCEEDGGNAIHSESTGGEKGFGDKLEDVEFSEITQPGLKQRGRVRKDSTSFDVGFYSFAQSASIALRSA